MIPTPRRNPWAPIFWVILVLWIVALIAQRITDANAFAWAGLGLTIGLVVVWSLERHFEAESARIVAMAVFGRDQEAAWLRGYDSGVVAERRRQQR